MDDRRQDRCSSVMCPGATGIKVTQCAFFAEQISLVVREIIIYGGESVGKREIDGHVQIKRGTNKKRHLLIVDAFHFGISPLFR